MCLLRWRTQRIPYLQSKNHGAALVQQACLLGKELRQKGTPMKGTERGLWREAGSDLAFNYSEGRLVGKSTG